jgi:hypothetical protein
MKRVGMIIIALVLALGALGASYAAWAHTITVGATVNTGTASAIFDGSLTTQNADNFGDNICYAEAVPNADPKYLDVTVYNAYPGVKITNLPYYVKNNGTVPIKFDSLTLNDTVPANQVTIVGSTIPGDSLIAPDAQGTLAYLTIQVSTDTEIIPESSNFSFTANLAYSVVVGP